jgi:GNAT superfamily N-acetyltransferase
LSDQIKVIAVSSKVDLKNFIELPWQLYKDDPNWVPPLLSDMKNTLNPKINALLGLGPNTFFLAYKNRLPAGRIGVGIDYRLNEAKKIDLGYFTLFECIDDYQVASALFNESLAWLREKGAKVVTGPQSPSNGDDYRGLLVKGYNTPPVLLNSYNPCYYAEFIENYGFEKQFDRYAYYYDLKDGPPVRLKRGVVLAQKRYGFKVRPLDLKNLDHEVAIIKEVVDQAMPDWPDMIPPGDEELAAEVEKLRHLAVKDLVLFAENSDRECLGFSVALPDYNQILTHLNGRLFPVGFLKYLWYKRKITGLRMFALFVTAKGRRRGVSAALYYYTMSNAYRMGYTYGEGSTIHEFNQRMNLDAKKAGGKLCKIYRIYHKLI